jgi:ADP-heptose:LPS heptosyltransferase
MPRQARFPRPCRSVLKLMRTLIHHDGSLGDTLLSLPCFIAINASSSSIHFVGHQHIAELLNEAGYADTFSSADSRYFSSLYTAADERVREFLASFERAFIFTTLNDSPVAANIGTIVPRTRTIAVVPPDGAGIHTAVYRLAQLPAPLQSPPDPVLKLSGMHGNDAQVLLGDAGRVGNRLLVAVHPGSGGRRKCWPLERYFELIARLAKGPRPFFLLFSGPAEEDLKERIDRFVLGRDDAVHVAGGKLTAAASMLSRCDLYVGNDSGFSHLAAAMNCHVLALFGPTDPAVWKPMGSRVEVVSAGYAAPVDLLSVETVYRKAASLLGQSPIPDRLSGGLSLESEHKNGRMALSPVRQKSTLSAAVRQ